MSRNWKIFLFSLGCFFFTTEVLLDAFPKFLIQQFGIPAEHDFWLGVLLAAAFVIALGLAAMRFLKRNKDNGQ